MKHQSTGAKGDLVNILVEFLKAFLILFIENCQNCLKKFHSCCVINSGLASESEYNAR